MRFCRFVGLLFWGFVELWHGQLCAQNLVPNPSFEQIRRQPCNFLSNEDNISRYVANWFTPTGGSTDVWFYDPAIGSCRQNTQIIQTKPNSGSYCIGLVAYTREGNQERVYREYASVRLKQPLQTGKIYQASMAVLLRPLGPGISVAVDKLGLYFSTDSVYRVETIPNKWGRLLDYKPQVNANRMLNQIGQWTQVTGCFRADSAYQFLTIGNFFSDRDTRIQNPDLPNFFRNSYYLIDDVVVREVTTRELPVALGRHVDTTLCPGKTWPLSLPANGGLLRWSDGSNSPVRLFDEPGSYWVTATQGECSVTDSIRIRRETPLRLPADTVACQDRPFILKPAGQTTGLLWSDGSREKQLVVEASGTYWVGLPASVCNLADTVNVRLVACPGMIPNVITPNNDGFNDTFVITNSDRVAWRIQIYNRWGRRVYDSVPYRNEWGAEGLPTGMYYYLLTSTLLDQAYKGWVTVLR